MDQIHRPKIQIPKTKSEWLADFIGYVCLVFMISYLVLNWTSLPEEVPTHFGASGEADRWGSKFELLIVPVIAIVMHAFLMILEKFPHTHNYPERLNESNIHEFYTNSRQTLNYMKNNITCLFAYVVWRTVSIAIAKGADTSLGWPFFFLLGLLFVVLIWKILKIVKIK